MLGDALVRQGKLVNVLNSRLKQTPDKRTRRVRLAAAQQQIAVITRQETRSDMSERLNS